ncbi:hypothetical protein FQA47_016880 [Oryzias melastigma]|uniref:Uncharacterized protein n=1 Tax=Oryzias melastigma TaxID=30732 RepID=A0A834F070_ORYME|nr:hypothetical protein FQA47_016880 [Oryzias melastigma]
MASVLSVAPVSLELSSSPPRLYSSPPQVCRLHRAAPKPAKLRQGLTPNWRHNHKGIAKPLGGIKPK